MRMGTKEPTYFRIDRELKEALRRIAEIQHRPLGRQIEKYLEEGLLNDLENLSDAKQIDEFDRYLRGVRG
jgi:hypothetical protein